MKLGKTVLCIILSLSLAFVSVGYANFTTNLAIDGTLRAERVGIFITDMTVKSGTIGGLIYADKAFTLGNLQLEQGGTSSYTGTSYERNGTATTVDSTFTSTVRTVSGSGFRKTISTTEIKPVTVTLTVRNNTNDGYRYYFQGVSSTDDATLYTNGLISYTASVSDYADSDTEQNGSFVDEETMKIDVTFYLSGENTYAVSDSSFSMLLEKAVMSVVYGVDEAEIEDAVTSLVTNEFDRILNNDETYTVLTEAIVANYDGGTETDNRFWTGTYIGNVDGSSDEDTGIIQQLFGTDKITQIIGDTEQTVTVIIKWENIDGDESTGSSFSLTSDSGVTQNYVGCEMTLYMTTEDLINDWTFGTYAETVYATVYTCSTLTDSEGNTVYSDWYQFGDTYSGKAQVVGYVGGSNNGSFNTGEWYSTAAYHGLTSGKKLDEIIRAYIASLS